MTRASLFGVVPFIIVALTGAFACGDDDAEPTDAGSTETGPIDAGATAPSITAPPPGALPALVAGDVVAPVTFTASGTTPITWTATGALPPGMKLETNGSYAGTPSVIG